MYELVLYYGKKNMGSCVNEEDNGKCIGHELVCNCFGVPHVKWKYEIFTDNIATENILHIKRAFVKQTFLLQCIAIGIAFLSISESKWQYLIVWNLSLKSKEVYRKEFFDLKLNETQHEIWKFWEIGTQLQKFSTLNFSEIGQRIDWY